MTETELLMKYGMGNVDKGNEIMGKLLPKRGAVARCSMGKLGLITANEPVPVKYKEGESGVAWIGIHLGEEEFDTDSSVEKLITARSREPWSSRNPEVLYYLS